MKLKLYAPLFLVGVMDVLLAVALFKIATF